MKFFNIYFTLGLILCLAIMPLLSPVAVLLLINFLIVIVYISYKPTYVLHPNNIIFAFSFFYVVLPSSIDFCYVYFDLDYSLPWGRPVDWGSFHLQTYYDMLLVYLVMFFSFRYFIGEDVEPREIQFEINLKFLIYFYCFVVTLLFGFLYLSGGVDAWVESYKTTYLLGRKGLGPYNFLVLFMVDVLVFLLGLYLMTSKRLSKSWTLLFFALLVIVFASLLQGLKSRIIILLIIFFFSYLLRTKIKLSSMVLLGLLFFGLLYVGTYIRSDGYYDSVGVFFEYMMTYFNVYNLHDMIVANDSMNIGQTVLQIFIRPLQVLGLAGVSEEYDLSIMLTKVYFPNDWYSMNATQQWPLVTDLYYNYFGFTLGWLPLLLYAFILSKLYTLTKDGNLGVSLIYVLEFVRLFSTMRGTLIPWQIYVYIFFYIIMYLIISRAVREKKNNA